MGMVKNDALLCESRGYGHSDLRICHSCTGNYALKDWIRGEGEVGVCSYCGQRKKSVPLERLMEPIMDGIAFAYERAVDVLPYDGREGGYQGTTYSTEDLISEELREELDFQDEQTFLDVADLMAEEDWCDRNPYGMEPERRDYSVWKHFCQLVKYRSRYVFFMEEAMTGSEPEGLGVPGFDMDSPSEILRVIGSYGEKLGLIKMLSPRNRLYRGRTHGKENAYRKLSDFTPPPAERTRENRMSPQGIPMFYAALEPETALAEIDWEGTDYASVASFRFDEGIRVLDLTALDKLRDPSIFDAARRDRRPILSFLRWFAQDISQPVEEGRTVEYVPTQIVTEYFRRVFQTAAGKRVEGILYGSARRFGGTCVVLFADREDFLGKEEGSVRRFSMNPSKIIRYRKRYEKI